MASLCLHTWTHVPCLCAKYRRHKHVMQFVMSITNVLGKPVLTELSIHNGQDQPGVYEIIAIWGSTSAYRLAQRLFVTHAYQIAHQLWQC